MWVASAPHEVGGDELPGPGGGPKAAHNATPRHWLRGLGMDIHVVHPLTRPRDVTMEQLHPPVHLQGAAAVQPHPMMPALHPKWLQRSTFLPTPSPVTLVRGWSGPHSIRMRLWRMTSKLSICKSTM